jgi:hypothetical protein
MAPEEFDREGGDGRPASVPLGQRVVIKETAATTGRTWRDILFTVERDATVHDTFVCDDAEYSFEELCIHSLAENLNDVSVWQRLYDCMLMSPMQSSVVIQGRRYTREEIEERCHAAQ